MKGFRRNLRDLSLPAGFVLAALTALTFALHLTAVPVVMDVALASAAFATAAAVTLLAGVVRERRRPMEGRRVRFASAVGALLGVLIVAAVSVHQRFLSVRAVEVRFRNGEVDLAGTLHAPRTRDRHPAVVFVHASGPEARKEYTFFARLFARNGFAALAYDKRGVGRSSGKLYESDYRDYAEDALAAVRYLRERHDVDPACVGLIGFSEGEWVAPLAASLSDDIAFLVVVGPSGVSPAAQVNEEIALRLRAVGYSGADIALALALNERVLQYQRTGQAPAGLAEDLGAASNEPWFRAALDIPDELYPPDDYRWWRSVMDFSPGRIWEQVGIPVLLLKGGRDRNSTAERARSEIEAALTRGGNPDVEFVLFPDADHFLLHWPLGERLPPPRFASGYLQALAAWTRDRQCARR